MKQKKAQKKRDVDDKVTEVDEIRKELNRVNKVSVFFSWAGLTFRNRSFLIWFRVAVATLRSAPNWRPWP